MLNLKSTADLSMDKDALVKYAGEQGALAREGNDSMLAVGIRVYAASKHGGLTKGDCKDVYLAYAKAVNASQFGAKVDLSNEDSIKANVSKLAVFNRLAAVPGKTNRLNAVTKTVQVINETLAAQGKAKVGAQHYEKVIKVLRAVIKAGDAPNPNADEIAEIVFPAKSERDVLQRLEAIEARAQSEVDAGTVGSSYFASILAAAQDAIRQYKADQAEGAEGEEEEPVEGVDELAQILDQAA